MTFYLEFSRAAIENPVKERPSDVSVVHTSSPSYADVELKSVGEQINAANIAATFELLPLC